MNIKNFSTGIDIEQIDRFEKYSNNKDCRFVKRIFSPLEIDYCYSYKNSAEHLAAKYCAKEAVYKALSSLNIQDINYIDIEVLNDSNGVPYINLLKNNYPNLVIRVSLTHSKEYAAASVTIIET